MDAENLKNIFAWEKASGTYLLIFLITVAGVVGAFFLGSYLLGWLQRRRMENEIAEIERRCRLNDREADFVVHVLNKNDLNIPTTLYTSVRIFDTLVGREIELLMDSAAPQEVKLSTVALAYSAREKLYPQTRKVTLATQKSLMDNEPEAEGRQIS